jgi:hypothetical protein
LGKPAAKLDGLVMVRGQCFRDCCGFGWFLPAGELFFLPPSFYEYCFFFATVLVQSSQKGVSIDAFQLPNQTPGNFILCFGKYGKTSTITMGVLRT